MTTFGAIDAARSANLDADGRTKNAALARRLAEYERALALEILGFEDEGPMADDGRYPATGSELRRWASQKLSNEYNEREIARFCAEPMEPM